MAQPFVSKNTLATLLNGKIFKEATKLVSKSISTDNSFNKTPIKSLSMKILSSSIKFRLEIALK
jgi:hypothetical protein